MFSALTISPHRRAPSGPIIGGGGGGAHAAHYACACTAR
jgi:hypothetical protein